MCGANTARDRPPPGPHAARRYWRLPVQRREAGRGLCPVLVATTSSRLRGRAKRAARGRPHRELTSQHAWRALTLTTGRLVEAPATVRRGRRRHQLLAIGRKAKAPARLLFSAYLQTMTRRSMMRSCGRSTRRRASRHPGLGAAGQRRRETMRVGPGRGVAATQALLEERRRDGMQPSWLCAAHLVRN